MTTTTTTGMRRLRGDDGAYAILYAIAIVIFIGFAGVVVDINSARADRRVNRLASDSAALAAATELRSDGPNAQAACEKAAAYLKDNVRGLTVTPASLCLPFAAYADNAWTCPAAAVPFPPVVNGDYRITMTWPVVDGSPLLTNPDVRPGNVTQSGDAAFDGLEPCQRFAVSMSMERSFVFGPVIGGPSGTTTIASSVGRAAPEGTAGELAVALILLERHGCNVLSLPNTGPTVIVQGNGDRPGAIQADSTGSGTDGTCSSGKIYNVQQNDPARIVAAPAERAATGTTTIAQGIIGSVALTGVAAAQPSNVYSGAAGFRVRAQAASPPAVPLTQQVPTPRSLVTRSVVDSRYRIAVKDRIAAAQTSWTTPPPGPTCNATLQPACVVELSHPCKLNSAIPVISTNVYVRCSGGPANRTIAAEQFVFGGSGQNVIFDRTVKVGSGNSLAFRDTRRVLVRGDLENQGTLLVNNGAPANDCAAHQATTPGLTAALILDGSLTSTGTGALARLCSTTVILATCPIPVLDGTAPVTNTCTDHVEATGGTFDWAAPDAVNGVPPTDLDFAKLEDLALWGEASEDNRLGGGVSMLLSGVFFLPNANAFELGGNGAQKVTNAQMIVRRLEVSGSSTFSFRPDPDDVITIPFFGGVTLIR